MSTVAGPPEGQGVRTFARVLMWFTTLLVVTGVIVGLVMGTSGGNCSSGPCDHPHAGSGAGLAIVSLLLGVVAVMGNLILGAVLDRRREELMHGPS